MPGDSKAERAEHASQEMAAYLERGVNLEAPLTLDEAIRNALENNLDYRLMQFQRKIREEVETGARRRMLPDLLANASMEHQTKNRASRSQSVSSGNTSLESSFSSERTSRTADLTLAWNLLDFGISFFRARQEERQSLILETRIERMRQNLTLDVTRAFYSALVAQEAVARARALLTEAAERQVLVRSHLAEKQVPELEGLASEESLIVMKMRLRDFERELRDTKVELASLIGLAPGADFVIAPVDFFSAPTRVNWDVTALEQEALARRPELFEKDFEEQIARDETRIALANMFPNVNLFTGPHTDRNAFLYWNNWYTLGIRSSYNLLSLPAQYSLLRQSRQVVDLNRQRRMALAIGVLVQTHLALVGYDDAQAQYGLLKELLSVRERKRDAIRKRAGQGEVDAGMVLQADANALFARVRFMTAYAQLMTARERIYNTVGRSGRDNADDRFAMTTPRSTAVAPAAEAVRPRSVSAQRPGALPFSLEYDHDALPAKDAFAHAPPRDEIRASAPAAPGAGVNALGSPLAPVSASRLPKNIVRMPEPKGESIAPASETELVDPVDELPSPPAIEMPEEKKTSPLQRIRGFVNSAVGRAVSPFDREREAVAESLPGMDMPEPLTALPEEHLSSPDDESWLEEGQKLLETVPVPETEDVLPPDMKAQVLGPLDLPPLPNEELPGADEAPPAPAIESVHPDLSMPEGIEVLPSAKDLVPQSAERAPALPLTPPALPESRPEPVGAVVESRTAVAEAPVPAPPALPPVVDEPLPVMPVEDAPMIEQVVMEQRAPSAAPQEAPVEPAPATAPKLNLPPLPVTDAVADPFAAALMGESVPESGGGAEEPALPRPVRESASAGVFPNQMLLDVIRDAGLEVGAAKNESEESQSAAETGFLVEPEPDAEVTPVAEAVARVVPEPLDLDESAGESEAAPSLESFQLRGDDFGTDEPLPVDLDALAPPQAPLSGVAATPPTSASAPNARRRALFEGDQTPSAPVPLPEKKPERPLSWLRRNVGSPEPQHGLASQPAPRETVPPPSSIMPVTDRVGSEPVGDERNIRIHSLGNED